MLLMMLAHGMLQDIYGRISAALEHVEHALSMESPVLVDYAKQEARSLHASAMVVVDVQDRQRRCSPRCWHTCLRASTRSDRLDNS